MGVQAALGALSVLGLCHIGHAEDGLHGVERRIIGGETVGQVSRTSSPASLYSSAPCADHLYMTMWWIQIAARLMDGVAAQCELQQPALLRRGSHKRGMGAHRRPLRARGQ